MQSIPNSLLIISSIRLSCQEPDSNPYSLGCLRSHFRTALRRDLGSLLLRPFRFLLNLPFSPRSRMRTSQSRAVEYAMPRYLAIFRMLWPFFLSRHASSLSFARGSLSFSIVRVSLFMLTLGMNRHPHSSLLQDSAFCDGLSVPTKPLLFCIPSMVGTIEVFLMIPDLFLSVVWRQV